MTESQPTERTSRSRWNGITGLCGLIVIQCVWSAGCSIIFVGEPVQELDLSHQDPAEENLKAIRSILANPPHRTGPPNENQPLDSSSISPFGGEPTAVARSYSPVSPNVGTPAGLPWTPPSPTRPTGLERPVPVYTVPAPVPASFSGSIRCTPDGFGGQRCRGG
ncbi:MAG TPA: hypothetical protein VJ746_06325 [Nitrospira sp.]|nr:hypothetical protein [Nitrospira sp.]